MLLKKRIKILIITLFILNIPIYINAMEETTKAIQEKVEINQQQYLDMQQKLDNLYDTEQKVNIYLDKIEFEIKNIENKNFKETNIYIMEDYISFLTNYKEKLKGIEETTIRYDIQDRISNLTNKIDIEITNLQIKIIEKKVDNIKKEIYPKIHITKIENLIKELDINNSNLKKVEYEKNNLDIKKAIKIEYDKNNLNIKNAINELENKIIKIKEHLIKKYTIEIKKENFENMSISEIKTHINNLNNFNFKNLSNKLKQKITEKEINNIKNQNFKKLKTWQIEYKIDDLKEFKKEKEIDILISNLLLEIIEKEINNAENKKPEHINLWEFTNSLKCLEDYKEEIEKIKNSTNIKIKNKINKLIKKLENKVTENRILQNEIKKDIIKNEVKQILHNESQKILTKRNDNLNKNLKVYSPSMDNILNIPKNQNFKNNKIATIPEIENKKKKLNMTKMYEKNLINFNKSYNKATETLTLLQDIINNTLEYKFTNPNDNVTTQKNIIMEYENKCSSLINDIDILYKNISKELNSMSKISNIKNTDKLKNEYLENKNKTEKLKNIFENVKIFYNSILKTSEENLIQENNVNNQQSSELFKKNISKFNDINEKIKENLLNLTISIARLHKFLKVEKINEKDLETVSNNSNLICYHLEVSKSYLKSLNNELNSIKIYVTENDEKYLEYKIKLDKIRRYIENRKITANKTIEKIFKILCLDFQNSCKEIKDLINSKNNLISKESLANKNVNFKKIYKHLEIIYADLKDLNAPNKLNNEIKSNFKNNGELLKNLNILINFYL